MQQSFWNVKLNHTPSPHPSEAHLTPSALQHPPRASRVKTTFNNQLWSLVPVTSRQLLRNVG